MLHHEDTAPLQGICLRDLLFLLRASPFVRDEVRNMETLRKGQRYSPLGASQSELRRTQTEENKCILALAWSAHPRWRLARAGNRDEIHRAPAQPLARWDTPKNLPRREAIFIKVRRDWAGVI